MGPRRWPEGRLLPRAGAMNPSQSAINQWGWCFHSLRGGIDTGYLRFSPRMVEGVDVWNIFLPGDGKLSCPNAAGPRRWPGGQLSMRAGSMSPSQSAIPQWGWGLRTLRGGIDQGDLRVRPRVFADVDVRKGL